MAHVEGTNNKDVKKINIIAQEIQFARILAGNDKKLRDKTLTKLKKWFQFRSQSSIPLTDENFMRLWKGLFFCMWMSDKMLIQEECAERIADLIHSFTNKESSILFFKCFLQTMANEWFGIDQLRLNKFLMLVRRCLRQSLEILKKNNWDEELINLYSNVLTDTGLSNSPKVPLGLKMHIIEIFLEELAKISQGKLTDELTTEFLRPFVKYLSIMNDQREIDHIFEYVFIYLIKQSKIGIEYAEKFEAWRSRGFPGGHINCLEKVSTENDSDSDGEQDETLNFENLPKDPRAGQVDVILKQIPFSSEQIIKLVKEYQFNKGTNTKSRKAMNEIIRLFSKLKEKTYPLGIKTVSIPNPFLNTQGAAEDLLKFEEELYSDIPKSFKQLAKVQKRKLRSTQLDSDELLENEEHPKTKKLKENVNKTENDALEEFIQRSEKNIFQNGLIVDEFLKKNNTKKKEKGLNSTNVNETNRKRVVAEKANNSSKSKDPKKGKKLKLLESKIAKLKKPIIIGIAQPSGVWEVTDTESNTVKNSKSESNCEVLKIEQKVKSKKINKGPLKENNSLQTLLQTSAKKTNSISIKNSIQQKSKSKKSLNFAKNEIFPQTEWDVPESGEIEIVIPAKKFEKKIVKNTIKTNSQSIQKTKNNKLKKTPIVKIKKKSVINSADKKVKIALQKNKAQGTVDYIKQVRSSPAIPFDATKKPSKPLLKPTNIKSPINPFYKLKDSFF